MTENSSSADGTETHEVDLDETESLKLHLLYERLGSIELQMELLKQRSKELQQQYETLTTTVSDKYKPAGDGWVPVKLDVENKKLTFSRPEVAEAK